MEKKVINNTTRDEIKKYLIDFIQQLINEHKADGTSNKKQAASPSSKGNLKPFHQAIVPNKLLLISAFERSLSTKLGSTFEECAFLIASQRYRQVQRNYRVNGEISSSALQKIEQLIGDVSQSNRDVNFLKMVDDLLNSSNSSDQTNQTRLIIVDLYFEDDANNKYFFEIKSPKPNKGQCLEVTERLLKIHAKSGKSRPEINTYFAMPYNPYGSRENYNHGFSLKYLDMQNQVLLGSEFWDLIGGKGTYNELLNIYAEVGNEKSEEIQTLNFGVGK